MLVENDVRTRKGVVVNQRRFYSWMEWGCANSKRIANLWSIQWSPTSRHHDLTYSPPSQSPLSNKHTNHKYMNQAQACTPSFPPSAFSKQIYSWSHMQRTHSTALRSYPCDSNRCIKSNWDVDDPFCCWFIRMYFKIWTQSNHKQSTYFRLQVVAVWCVHCTRCRVDRRIRSLFEI